MPLIAMTCLLFACIIALNLSLSGLLNGAFILYEDILARNAERREITRFHNDDQIVFINAYMHIRLIHYTDPAWLPTGTATDSTMPYTNQ